MTCTQMAIVDIHKFNPHGHVYSGRGEKYKKLNMPFRLKIKRDSPRYIAASNNDIKRQIAQELYLEIQEEGGLFFDEDGNEMTEKDALKRIKKALKDTKKRVGRSARRKKETKARSKSHTTLSVSKNSFSFLTGSGEDHLFAAFSGSSDDVAFASLLSSQVPQRDLLPPQHHEEVILEDHTQIPEYALQTSENFSGEGITVEELRGSLQSTQNFAIQDDAYMERILQEPMADFDIDSISLLDDVDIVGRQRCLEHQERPRDSLHTPEQNAQEAVFKEQVPEEDVAIMANTDMATFLRYLDLQEFDDTNVGPIPIEMDEHAW